MYISAQTILGAFAAAGMAFLTSLASAERGAEPIDVDLELVLAADRSASMSRLMLVRQRNGFAEAFRSEELRRTIQSGPLRRIAVVYVEWSDETDQEVVIPWTKLETLEDFEQFADAINGIVITYPNRETAIGAALLHAQGLLNSNSFNGRRQIIDLSGNGRNSDGPPIGEALQILDSFGTTVNGLVLPEEDFPVNVDHTLSDYFWREVVSGPGGFAVTVLPDIGYVESIIRKLVLEVAWNTK